MTTADRLHRRVGERFPDAGLTKVALELRNVAAESQDRLDRIRRPLIGVRALVAVAIVLIGAVLVVGAGFTIGRPTDAGTLSDIVQAIDAAVNQIVFLAVAIFFLVNLEGRIKRRDALRDLHELRSLAHVVDMHQLTKDPDQVLSSDVRDAAPSSERSLTRSQLSRYLDYCSEMLSIASKLAALYAQYLNDPVVLSAVNDVESLTSSLSVKIWQKNMILGVIALPAGEGEGGG